MGRRKIAKELIGNLKSRAITFEKRKESIKKMSHQLSTLCGVDVCAVLYQGPDSAAETYPSDPNRVRAILNRYTSIPKEETAKRSISLSVDSAIKKCSNYPAWVSRLDGCSKDQISGFLSALDQKLGVVEDRMARAQTQAMLQWQKPEDGIAAPSTSAAMYAAAFGGGGRFGMHQPSSMQPFYGGATGTTLPAFEERTAAFRRTQVQNQASVQWRPSDAEMGALSTPNAMYTGDTSNAAFGGGMIPPFYVGAATGTKTLGFETLHNCYQQQPQAQSGAMVQWRPSDAEMGAPSTSTAVYAADTSSAAFGCGFEPLQMVPTPRNNFYC